MSARGHLDTTSFTFIKDLDLDMRVSFRITSRPEVDVEDAAEDTTNFIHIDSAWVNRDLSNIINIRVSELERKRKNYPPRLTKDTKDALQQQAGGAFLMGLARPARHRYATTAKRAREKLAALPKGLPGVYKRTVDNINDDHIEDAAFILP